MSLALSIRRKRVPDSINFITNESFS